MYPASSATLSALLTTWVTRLKAKATDWLAVISSRRNRIISHNNENLVCWQGISITIIAKSSCVSASFRPRFKISDTENEATLTIANVTESDTGEYSCKVQTQDLQQIISTVRLDVLRKYKYLSDQGAVVNLYHTTFFVPNVYGPKNILYFSPEWQEQTQGSFLFSVSFVSRL